MKKSTLIVAIAFLIGGFGSSASAQFIYVANAGEDTVSKIDVTSNTEVARYATWFNAGTNSLIAAHLGNAWAGPAPSRIARDSLGNAYVLNRFFSTGTGGSGHIWSNPPHNPVLFKIAPSGGNPTSSGSGLPAVLPITDTNNNYDIDAAEITDKAILWAKSIGQAGDKIGVGRALAVDKSGNVWVGMYGTNQYYKVDPNGNPLAGPISTGTHRPYGCAVDMNGKLWSVDEVSGLAEFDTTIANPVATVHDHASFGRNYSLSIFNDCSSTPAKVKVYISERQFGRTYIVYDPQAPPASRFSNSPTTIPQFGSFAIGVDSQGNIISGSISGQVIKTTSSGNLLWSRNISTSDLHGIIIDPFDNIWAVDKANNQVVKIDASGAVGPSVKVGNLPYTYGNPPPPTCAGTATPTPTPTPTATATPLISPTPTPTPTPAGCAQVAGEARCLADGSYSYTFTVKNNSGNPASQILLTPAQGSTFTLAPQLTNLSPSLQNGQSTTITTNIGNAKPGDKVCFFVSLMSEKTQCCIVQVCLTMPNCGEVSPTPTVTPSLPPPARQAPRGRRRP